MTLTLEARPMTPNRRRSPYIARARGVKLPSPAQSAREHAERWLIVIRHWEAKPATVRIPRLDYIAFTDPDESTLGECGPTDSRVLITPAGEIYQGRIADQISDWEISPVPEQAHIGKVLHRLRSGSGPATLLKEGGGWASPRQRSAGVAVALLTLAVEFGDEAAGRWLPACRSAMQGRD